MKEDLTQKFKLPAYTKGKSFAEASKAIMKRFEGREDSEAVNTQKALLGRLREAQEYTKQMQEVPDTGSNPEAGDIAASGQNQNFMGGIMGAAGGGGNPLAAVGGAAQVGQDILGKTGVDTSGATSVESMSGAGEAGAGALKGAAAGSSYGPYGMAAGAIVGGVGGLIKADKHNKDAAVANRNNTYAQSNVNNNSFAKGGKMNSHAGGGGLDKLALNQGLTDFLAANDRPKVQSVGSPDAEGIASPTFDTQGAKGTEQTVSSVTSEGINPVGFSQELASSIPTPTSPNDGNGVSDEGSGTALSQALRYAPAAANLGQLLSMKKPGEEALGRINARYSENLTDEQAIQNIVKEQTAGTREAIVGSSGGSGSAARANLLANSLQGNKALSDAYMSAVQSNQGENRVGQQFNLGVDQTNLQQSNAENTINAQNQGNFDTQKSKLMAQLGDDVGQIGKEELFKKYPELMGADYNWLGRFIK